MPPLGHPLRPAAINLYKRLHRIGRDYPDPKYAFLPKLRSMSAKWASETDEGKIQEYLKLGEWIYKETETLYSLKKYRTLRKRYIED